MGHVLVLWHRAIITSSMQPRSNGWHVQGTPSLEQLKLKYYHLMITYHAHHADYLEICRCYRAIYETPCIANDQQQKMAVLRQICWFSVLAAASSDQV